MKNRKYVGEKVLEAETGGWKGECFKSSYDSCRITDPERK